MPERCSRISCLLAWGGRAIVVAYIERKMQGARDRVGAYPAVVIDHQQ
jgi:hypothetical protein